VARIDAEEGPYLEEAVGAGAAIARMPFQHVADLGGEGLRLGLS
jgi:hypothetical protein